MSTSRAAQGDSEKIASPAQYGELLATFAGIAVWIVMLLSNGPLGGLQTIWILLIALGLGIWTTMRRLCFSASRLRVTLGPWSRAVDLNQLHSIRWKDNTFGYGAHGTINLRDRSGHRVSIEVGRFKRGEEWGPLLLKAATASVAMVDESSRHILEHGGQDPLLWSSVVEPSATARRWPTYGFTWKNLLLFPGFGFLALISTAALPLVLLLIGNEQNAAGPYRAAPVCSSQPTTPCRQIREAMVTDRGEGQHLNGTAGGDTWLRLRIDGSSEVYVDLPAYPQQVPFQPGQVVSAEVWNGSITLVSAAGTDEPTYDNPDWGAHDSAWAVAIPLLFLVISAITMTCVGVAMWHERRRARASS